MSTFRSLLPDRPKDSRRKTKVVKKTNSPSWEEDIVYKGIAKTQLPSIGVSVVVWDVNRLGHCEYLGGCNLNSGSRKFEISVITGTPDRDPSKTLGDREVDLHFEARFHTKMLWAELLVQTRLYSL